MSVHIFTLKVVTVVSNHDAIRIHNWQDPKFKLISHFMAKNVLPKQVIYETVNNEASMGFSTVLAS